MTQLGVAARSLRRTPAFTLAAAGTLALGIGAAVLVFTVLDSVILRPMPYRDAKRLVFLWIHDAKRGILEEGLAYPTYVDWKAQSRSFADIALTGRGFAMRLLRNGEPQRLSAGVVTSNYFSILGVQPALGRTFTAAEEERGDLVAVISHGLWQRLFGGSPSAINQQLDLDGQRWRVVGVMPPHFAFPQKHEDLWVAAHRFPPLARFMERRTGDFFIGLARLKPGITVETANAEMNAIGERLAETYKITDPDFGGFGVNVVPLETQVFGRRLPATLWLLLGAVGFLLLIACVNLANLMLARGALRRPELAIRVALGAPLRALLSPQISEGLLLALAGAVAGLLLAWFGLRMLPIVAPGDLPRFNEIGIRVEVVVFALGVSFLCCLLFAALPAWSQARIETTRSATPRTGRTQSALVIAELAAAVVLVAAASLFLRSLLEVRKVPPGFEAHNLLLYQMDRSGPQTSVFYRQLFEGLTALPGVRAAGSIGDFFIERNPDYSVTIEGRPTVNNEQVTVDPVSRGFLEAIGASLVRGRHLTDADYHDRPTSLIINETFARRFFPDEDPIGRRMKFAPAESKEPWITIVGVVSDLRRRGLEQHPVCEAFGPLLTDSMDIAVRTAVPPETLGPAVREVVRQLDPKIPVYGITTAERRLEEFAADRRLETTLLGLFSALALALAAVGIYGVLQYLIAQRRREIGIRMAVGARPSDVRLEIIRRSFIEACAGLAIGATILALAGPLYAHLLYGVGRFDTLALSGTILLAVTLIASWIPATFAARTDPAQVLRE